MKIESKLIERTTSEVIEDAIKTLPKEKALIKFFELGRCELLSVYLHFLIPQSKLVFVNDDKNKGTSLYHSCIYLDGKYIDVNGIIAIGQYDMHEYIRENYSEGDDRFTIYKGIEAEERLLCFYREEDLINPKSFYESIQNKLDLIYDYGDESELVGDAYEFILKAMRENKLV